MKRDSITFSFCIGRCSFWKDDFFLSVISNSHSLFYYYTRLLVSSKPAHWNTRKFWANIRNIILSYLLGFYFIYVGKKTIQETMMLDILSMHFFFFLVLFVQSRKDYCWSQIGLQGRWPSAQLNSQILIALQSSCNLCSAILSKANICTTKVLIECPLLF